MITYLNGNIIEIGENAIIIETYGIGYEVFCAAHQFYDELHTNTPIKVYIYEHIKEDSYDLYGFKVREERELFKKLTSVSGIGPKGGMQILNTYTSQDIISIILSEDSKALSKVNGIGPKTAQRIILELKDSMLKLYTQNAEQLLSHAKVPHTQKNEAVEALVALGYAQAEAVKAVNAIFDERDSSEQLIRKALSLLGL
ncbi:Holliday junction branch migration protein RuvA [Cellulosilyticum sp. I15G10I2]|uniref:Holliday junction branch migration protein RuvA n=1 Tax=Cellulosilyticum sp. I15G10I2 TaxID=1892843 RepID=UPI00085C808D|nr:Holliday junction branch migration protein RuvA [Cellulosilyticum sp. I15G10I2]